MGRLLGQPIEFLHKMIRIAVIILVILIVLALGATYLLLLIEEK